MKIIKLWILVILSALFVKSNYAQEIEISNYINKTMSERNIPGVSVAVIQDDEVTFMQSFGIANLETNTPVKNESVFQLASLTKPFTALCIMKLVEQGKIGLQNPITTYIDSLPDEYELITVHNLLTHTAGFPDQVNLVYDNSPVMDISTKKQLEIILEAPLLFPASEACSYADPGYFLLGMIIEKASGHLYKDYLQQEIFKPFGMEYSLVENRWAIIENRVSPYKFVNNETINGRRDYQHELPSHFGILSTITDLTKWEIALRDNSVVSSGSLEKMWTPAVLNNGNDALTWGVNYGYGWMLGDIRGHKYAEHGGFSGTHDLHFIDKNLSVIVLTNLDVMSNSDPRSIAINIAGIVDSELAKPSSSTPIDAINNAEIQELMVSFSQNLNNGIPEELLAKQFASFLSNLPHPVLDRFLTDWKSFKELKCIGKDELESEDIFKFGEKIKTIWHYQLINENNSSSYAIYLTNENKIAGITKWKE
jgi:CubicO group peptidase (beta-lactamase class C family)